MALTEADRETIHMISREVTQELADKIGVRLDDIIERMVKQREARVAERIAHHAATCQTVVAFNTATDWGRGAWFVMCGLSSIVGSGVMLGAVLIIRLWS